MNIYDDIQLDSHSIYTIQLDMLDSHKNDSIILTRLREISLWKPYHFKAYFEYYQNM